MALYERLTPPVLLIAHLCGCAGSQTGRGTPDDGPLDEPGEVPGIEVTVVDVPLSSPPAPHYGGEVDHALRPAEELVVATITRAGLAHDPRLSRAARELARTAPDSLNIPGSLVDGVMDWAGLINPRPRLSVVEFSDHDGRCTVDEGPGVDASCAAALQSAVEEAFASPLPNVTLNVGVGVVPLDASRGRIIVAITEQNVELAPIPVSAAMGARVPLRGRLLGGRRNPHIQVVDAEERGHEIPLSRDGEGYFSSEVGCDYGRGGYQVELLADGPYGTEIVANFRLFCGVEPPRSVTMTVEHLAPDIGIEAVERANFVALNRTRRQNGLPPLTWDDDVAAVARAHSDDMRRSGFVGHRSPTTGLAGDRFQKAGIKGSVIRENIARGYGPNGIHEGLMSSPGHRGNILSEDVTHVGVGAVYGESESDAPSARRPIFLTQNFYSPRGADYPDEPVDALRSRVDANRRGAGLTPLRWDEELSRLAQAFADGVARGREGQTRQQYQAGLNRSTFESVETQQTIAASFSALGDLDIWRTRIQGVVGIGVARISEGEHRDSVVLIIAVGRR